MTSEPGAARRPLRRTVLGPVAVTGVLIALVTAATMALLAPLIAGPRSLDIPPTINETGWVLTWLLLGLTAGYALSGSA